MCFVVNLNDSLPCEMYFGEFFPTSSVAGGVQSAKLSWRSTLLIATKTSQGSENNVKVTPVTAVRERGSLHGMVEHGEDLTFCLQLAMSLVPIHTRIQVLTWSVPIGHDILSSLIMIY